MYVILTTLVSLYAQVFALWGGTPDVPRVPGCGAGTDGTVRFAAELHDADAVVLAQRIDAPGPGVKRYFVWKGLSGVRTGSVVRLRVYRDDREEPFEGLVLAVLNRGREGVYDQQVYEQQPDGRSFADPGMLGSLGGPFGSPPIRVTLRETALSLAAPTPCRLQVSHETERRDLAAAVRSADLVAVVEPRRGRHVVQEALAGDVSVGDDVEVPGLGEVSALVIERGDDIIAYEAGRPITGRTWLSRSELCGSALESAVPRRLCIDGLPVVTQLGDVEIWLRRTRYN